jgi:hypothetical protein
MKNVTDDTALLIKIVVKGMTLMFLGASMGIVGLGRPFFYVADHFPPQLQPIFARLTANLL